MAKMNEFNLIPGANDDETEYLLAPAGTDPDDIYIYIYIYIYIWALTISFLTVTKSESGRGKGSCVGAPRDINPRA
jgi:hypothetical protein